MKKLIFSVYSGLSIGEFDIFPNADLRGINLFDADLRDANLSGADLSSANLRDANLAFANLSDAGLHNANLFNANLSHTNLSGANLSGANLCGADLRGAILYGANLSCVNLEGAKLPKFQIPQDEELIVFKKLLGNKIAKLRIPCRAKRTASLIGKKCRAERAIVLEIYDLFYSTIKHQIGKSLYNWNFVYEVGKEVKPTQEYDGDIRYECRPGIHFFMTKEEAEKYGCI